ncbi:hypothetical protein [Neorhizobium sp. NCHU2750]|uniref:hypothetical protein n=1 Tax=Neorhizobium sp. NCHU2750 TaxID=1825976 RepID=UPI000E72C494|nr:hypothetical protein NCHU2750_28020 [Neorhizobium sp. NCHU2750]
MPAINSVSAVYSVPTDASALIVVANITDMQGETYDCEYCTRPSDPDGGPNSMNGLFQQWLGDHAGQFVILDPPPAPPSVYQISKTTPWLRMTDDEAATMDAVMSETTARLKQIYMAATYLASNDPLWATLHEMLVNAFGSDRADQLLAPET